MRKVDGARADVERGLQAPAGAEGIAAADDGQSHGGRLILRAARNLVVQRGARVNAPLGISADSS